MAKEDFRQLSTCLKIIHTWFSLFTLNLKLKEKRNHTKGRLGSLDSSLGINNVIPVIESELTQ